MLYNCKGCVSLFEFTGWPRDWHHCVLSSALIGSWLDTKENWSVHSINYCEIVHILCIESPITYSCKKAFRWLWISITYWSFTPAPDFRSSSATCRWPFLQARWSGDSSSRFCFAMPLVTSVIVSPCSFSLSISFSTTLRKGGGERREREKREEWRGGRVV